VTASSSILPATHSWT